MQEGGGGQGKWDSPLKSKGYHEFWSTKHSFKVLRSITCWISASERSKRKYQNVWKKEKNICAVANSHRKKGWEKECLRVKVQLKNSCGTASFLLLFKSYCSQERIFWAFFVRCTRESPNSITLTGVVCKNPEMGQDT